MRTIEWRNGSVVTIDQSRLPHDFALLELKDLDEVVHAITSMKIRGAPLLGAAAAFALALVVHNSEAAKAEDMLGELEKAAQLLRQTRPTAVNLPWAIDRVLGRARLYRGNAHDLATHVIEEAQKIATEDSKANQLIGSYGADLILDGDAILTHCNAGELATVEHGTALGVITTAWGQGKKIEVYATETRPKMQGARLTMYELKRTGIPATLITDNMVGYVMYKQLVTKVIVGADRIVRNGVINKIGTYSIAVLSREHSLPFYVAAPKSTFDLARDSEEIVIEERPSAEVTHLGSQRIAPEGVIALNPAFDLTPMDYVSAVICEDGILTRENIETLKKRSL